MITKFKIFEKFNIGDDVKVIIDKTGDRLGKIGKVVKYDNPNIPKNFLRVKFKDYLLVYFDRKELKKLKKRDIREEMKKRDDIRLKMMSIDPYEEEEWNDN